MSEHEFGIYLGAFLVVFVIAVVIGFVVLSRNRNPQKELHFVTIVLYAILGILLTFLALIIINPFS